MSFYTAMMGECGHGRWIFSITDLCISWYLSVPLWVAPWVESKVHVALRVDGSVDSEDINIGQDGMNYYTFCCIYPWHLNSGWTHTSWGRAVWIERENILTLLPEGNDSETPSRAFQFQFPPPHTEPKWPTRWSAVNLPNWLLHLYLADLLVEVVVEVEVVE